MPCAAPPTRVYPGRDGARPNSAAAGLSGRRWPVLPDAAADADCVAETAGFTVPGALLQAVTATPMPITTGTAKRRDPYMHHCRLSW